MGPCWLDSDGVPHDEKKLPGAQFDHQIPSWILTPLGVTARHARPNESDIWDFFAPAYS
jgi:hypothetical protein